MYLCHSGLAYDTRSVLSHDIVLCSHVVGVLYMEGSVAFSCCGNGEKGNMFLLVRHMNRYLHICVWMNTALLGS